MTPIDPQTLLTQLNWRYATKKFDPARKVPAEHWNVLEQALILTPSSYGLEPWHFLVITSQVVKESLLPAAYGQRQVADASHVVVFTVRKNVDPPYVEKFIQRVSQVRGVPLEKLEGYKGMMLGAIKQMGPQGVDQWSSRQVYIALGFLLQSAALLGIDVCPMEGISAAQVDQILGLEAKGLSTLAIATVGYRAADDAAANHKKIRFSAEDVLTHID